MTIPPGLTCTHCPHRLNIGTTHNTPDGIRHTHCPHTCLTCGADLPAKNRTGHCHTCYHRRYKAGLVDTLDKPPATRPCHRCGIHTTNQQRLCRDCRDVLGQEVAQWAS